MPHLTAIEPEKRRKFVYGASACVLLVFVGLGVFANNGWLPTTDPMTGKKTGWFGKELPKNASSSWNPLAAPLPSPTPQLSKEYIYAGSRLLAVEDTNANAAPPADLAVWRPSTAVWWVLGGPGSQATSFTWGAGTDIPVPGDYDGDGKTDFSIFRPSTGDWWIVNSSDSSSYSVNWGISSDKTAPADYDGDGRTDAAMYRPSTGIWYILKSSDSQVMEVQFGATCTPPTGCDVPAPADYDGDGKADIGVWRNSNTTFYSINSSDGAAQTASFGSSGDVPVSADYDGDGKADFALFDPGINTITNTTSPNWYVLQSSNITMVSYRWGTSTDTPVQNDYDGDGKVDIAVWRGVQVVFGDLGNWYIRQSHDASTRTVTWGTSGDIPVPAFYRR